MPAKPNPPAEPRLLLPADAAATTEPQVFPALPGLYTPGEPAPLPPGYTLEDVERTIAEAALPLRVVKGDA